MHVQVPLMRVCVACLVPECFVGRSVALKTVNDLRKSEAQQDATIQYYVKDHTV
jgi:hypothetical protein